MSKDKSIQKIIYHSDLLSEKDQKKIIEKYGQKISVGDWFIYNDREFNKIIRFEEEKKYGVYVISYLFYLPDFKNPKTNRQNYDRYTSEKTVDQMLKEAKLNGEDFHEERDSLDQFLQYHHKLPFNNVEEYYQKAIDLISGKTDISVYQEQVQEVNDENALIAPNSKEALNMLATDMAEKQKQVAMLETFVRSEMEKKKAELDRFRQELNEIVQKFEIQIQKIYRVIGVIELYLGIHENIVQIQEGPKADPTTPISFRQQILYMDEEVGDFSVDFQDENIKKFDDWILKGKNIDRILPEIKGVVALCPRRKSKYYSDNERKQAEADAENKKTYILIRNGSNIYRIYGALNVRPRFFPLRNELQKMLDKLAEENKNGDQRYKWYDRDKMTDTERELHGYRQRAFLLQGLLDRTDIFEPMPQKLSIFKIDQSGGLVKFIYDDEAALPSGRLSFWDWHKEINSKIERGSRVIHSGIYSDYSEYTSRKDFKGRFFRHYSDYSTPDIPDAGQYLIEEVIKREQETVKDDKLDEYIKEHSDAVIEKIYLSGYKRNDSGYISNPNERNKKICYEEYTMSRDVSYLVIRYNPGGTVYSWTEGSSDRKNNLSFIIEREDHFILNYDQISLDDIEFYLDSRVDRPNYVYLLPLLKNMKQMRLKEIEHEKMFVQFLKDEVTRKGYAVKEGIDIDDIIWSYIEWWKMKNIWKRPVTKDDHLATRMIERRLFSQQSIKLLFSKIKRV